MAGNLTRDEALRRSRLLTVHSYAVELDLADPGDDTFSSVSVTRFRCAEPGAQTFINLAARSVTSVTLNGKPVDVAGYDGTRITLPGLAAENELQVVARCAYSRSGEGLHRFTDPADDAVYLYSNLEPFDAHRVYACFDQPDLKAAFELAVTAPAGWQVVSNMPPAPPAAADGTAAVRWQFPPTPPIPTYITAVAAGPYEVTRGSHDGIPLGVYCRASLARYLDAAEVLEVTGQGLDFFRQAFGWRYPFPKYDQLFVPEFNEGAMENAGCVTIVESYIFRSRVTEFIREARAETILHELAHMWFGDLVTMDWWDGLWLNESFATWASTLAEAEATRWRSAWATFAQLYKTRAYRQDQLSSTHPIAADIPDIAAVEVNFDGITYYKGASVLKQLVADVGAGNFLAGVRRYFDAHAWGNATLRDLLAALERASSRDLSAWSREWLETAGVNTLRPVCEVDPGGTITSFAVRQEAPAAHPVLRTHRIAIGFYDLTGDGALTRRRRVETDVAGELTQVAELAGERLPDLVLVNDDDLGYAKIRLDDHSLRTLAGSIGAFADPLPAALCWSATWDMCRDGELAARQYVRLVLSGIGSVADVTATQVLLTQAAQAVRLFADPSWAPGGLAKLADGIADLLAAAQPGSDLQLAYASALARTAVTQAHLDLLRGLLDGAAAVPGLAVDTDLRWALLHRLVSRGAAGEAEIEAELARDPTDAGERRAASCRAALPTPAAKRAAWDKIISGTQGNAMFRAALAGFNDQDQAELLAPYAQRYFDVVGRVWQEWSPDMAQRFALHAYPSTAVSPQTINMTEDFITLAGPPAPLRRLLAESRDDIARALRCREFDSRAVLA